MAWYSPLMNSGDDQIFHQGRLTFILTPERVIVQTSLPQIFYLEPTAHYFKHRIRLIRTMITLGEIRNLNELSTWCHQGGVRWIPTEYAGKKRDVVLH